MTEGYRSSTGHFLGVSGFGSGSLLACVRIACARALRVTRTGTGAPAHQRRACARAGQSRVILIVVLRIILRTHTRNTHC